MSTVIRSIIGNVTCKNPQFDKHCWQIQYHFLLFYVVPLPHLGDQTKMKILQIFLLGALSCILNIKCQPFAPSTSNNHLPAEVGVDKKSNTKTEAINGVNTYAAYNVRRKRFSFGSGCKKNGVFCKKDKACCSKYCKPVNNVKICYPK